MLFWYCVGRVASNGVNADFGVSNNALSQWFGSSTKGFKVPLEPLSNKKWSHLPNGERTKLCSHLHVIPRTWILHLVQGSDVGMIQLRCSNPYPRCIATYEPVLVLILCSPDGIGWPLLEKSCILWDKVTGRGLKLMNLQMIHEGFFFFFCGREDFIEIVTHGRMLKSLWIPS